jgi:hypothetical protein
VNSIETTIIDLKTRQPVVAELIDELSVDDLNRAEGQWLQTRIAGALRLHQSGQPVPEHWHWDWRRKSAKLKLLSYRCFAIECDGATQGLMLTSTTKGVARLAPDVGRPIVYIEFLEAAPWNVRPIVDAPRFGGIGLRLIESAVRYSNIEGFHGRVGLHALPQAVTFYREKCKMADLGNDPLMHDLPYFEFSRTQAAQFLGED